MGTGPWSQTLPGKSVPPNPRKNLGRIIDRLVRARRENILAQGGAEAAHEEFNNRARDILGKFCVSLLPHLACDSEAMKCNRKSNLGIAVSRVCKEQGVEISTALSLCILRELEGTGAVSVHGRVVELNGDKLTELCNESRTTRVSLMSSGGKDLETLEKFACERADKRKQRQKSREQGK